MDRLKELREAREAAQEVIVRIDHATSSLDSALSWGKWDIFVGEFFTSWIKRNKIKEANQNIHEITESLKTLNKELVDVNMNLPEGVSDTVSDNAWDIWFDNIFTDIRVQGEIKDFLKQLAVFRKSILDLISTLESEISLLTKI
ncbi:hypothetical protein ACVRW4_07975 [Streptococcus phocae subsp. phocae]